MQKSEQKIDVYKTNWSTLKSELEYTVKKGHSYSNIENLQTEETEQEK